MVVNAEENHHYLGINVGTTMIPYVVEKFNVFWNWRKLPVERLMQRAFAITSISNDSWAIINNGSECWGKSPLIRH